MIKTMSIISSNFELFGLRRRRRLIICIDEKSADFGFDFIEFFVR